MYLDPQHCYQWIINLFQVSSKLRAAYEMDLQAMAPQSVMFPGLHPAAMMSTAGLGAGQSYRPSQAGPPTGARPAPPQVPNETTYLFIPNAAVGAIIGRQELLLLISVI